jgi:SAM-dependent methyltransferase
MAAELSTASVSDLDLIRRTRRHPRLSQFDYLHVSRLVRDLEAALARVPGPVRDALDVYCGSRPYDDLMPAGARCIGLDVVGDEYGVADVVSDEFLPFDDASFDLVTCIEAFHYVEDPVHGVSEIRRVLRPGGTALIAVPFVWEYNRTILEHRYTGPELAALFDGWEDVAVVENGGRVVAWATLTATLLDRVRMRSPDALGLSKAAGVAFAVVYVVLNAIAFALDRLDERQAGGTLTLPMNLLLTARRPADDRPQEAG